MAGVEAVRVLSVLDEAAEGLKCVLFLLKACQRAGFRDSRSLLCVQAALIPDSVGFEVFGSAGWGTRAGDSKIPSVPLQCTVSGHNDQALLHLQSLTDTIIKLKAALTLKTSKDETFHPDLVKAITEVWRHMKVAHLLQQCTHPETSQQTIVQR